MKRTIELPEDLDSRIQDLARQWKEYAGTSYDETVRTLLVLGVVRQIKTGHDEQIKRDRKWLGNREQSN